MPHHARTPILALPILLLGCGSVEPRLVETPPQSNGTAPATAEPAPPTSPETASTTPTSTDFAALILREARAYHTYPRASDQANWAPFLCRSPVPASILPSAAPEDSPHGYKLYYLFARMDGDYIRLPFQRESATAAIGQVLIKQTFHPVEASPGANRSRDVISRDGVLYTAGEPADLFIMAKLDPATPGTDNGWIYGVTDPTGTTLRAAGRIESCMSCHTRAPRDRLFGLRSTWRP